MRQSAAFFDVDRTFVNGNVSYILGVKLAMMGKLSPWFIMRAGFYLYLHRINKLDFEKATEYLARPFIGWSLSESRKFLKTAIKDIIGRNVPGSIKKEVNRHRKSGRRLVFLSNCPNIIVDALKEYYKFDDAVCSRLEIKKDKLTGKVLNICFGEKKYQRFKEYVAKHRIDVKKSFFYTDSFSDISTLKSVGNPIAVNPDRQLRKYACEHGWRIIS